jgi:hypothetical protein
MRAAWPPSRQFLTAANARPRRGHVQQNDAVAAGISRPTGARDSALGAIFIVESP